MAIGFARLEFVKRSGGKTACAKAAYSSRSRVEQEASKHTEKKVYDWSDKEKPLHHEIMLPSHVDDKFKSIEVLWNMVEKSEVKKNAILGHDLVLALPDDHVISNEDRIELARSFVNEHFILKGFAAQLDIHSPDKSENESLDHNWHAHVFVTSRRFLDDGLTLEKNKPRDSMTVLRGGRVISGPDWGKLWTHHQNQYFESKGISLRVDPNGIMSQIHLGPVRMRGRALSLLEEHSITDEINAVESQNPKLILDKITQTQNIFTVEDVDRFLQKHITPDLISGVRESFWMQSEVVQLLDKENGQPQNRFSTKLILAEEKQLLRISDRLFAKKGFVLSDVKAVGQFSSTLTKEQSTAFRNIVSGSRLSCVEGYAGTGKSYLLSALKNVYEHEGFVVRGFGPDNATAKVLQDCGINKSENVYRFLFSHYHGKSEIKRSKEVWILDEAGKMASRPLLELLKVAEKNGVQMIFSGDTSQMKSVERGGMFKTFRDRYGYQFLGDIQRQKIQEQREIAKRLATGKIPEAFDAISRNGGFKWSGTKMEAIENLVKHWASDKELFPCSSTLILAHANSEVRILNEYVRIYRKERGELGNKEFLCETPYGKVYLSEGDSLEFRKNNKEIGVTNGLIGTIVKASPEVFVVKVADKNRSKEVTFDPKQYPYFQLGYATTYYRSQGKTVDRAYILHSPLMNREMFYVGLTRHVRKAFCFVSKTDAKCLSDLKRQAFKSSRSEVTTDFQTHAEIQKQKEIESKNIEIDSLKQSDSMLSRLKGNTLHVFGNLQSKVSGVLQKVEDRFPDKAFFKHINADQNERASVTEVIKPLGDERQESNASKEILKPFFYSKEDKLQTTNAERPHLNNREQTWNALSDKNKSIFKEYYSASDIASSLYTIVKAEAEGSGKDERLTTHFLEWQQACVKRNQAAYQALHAVSTKELDTLFSKASLSILQYRSSRYESSIQQKQSSQSEIENGLRENIDSLLFRLFPDGPVRRDKRGYRYGTKGSLVVAIQGEKAGSFYNFEKGEGGGLLKLIEDNLVLSKESSLDWARNFLGESRILPTQGRFNQNSLDTKNEDTWVTIKPPADTSAPSLSKISSKLDKQYTEVARHVYKDENGHELFYTLRLIDKTDPSKKIVLPLSYGFYKGGDESPRWSMKGFQADKKPLYNLDLIHTHQDSKVLLVEGEKTADAAKKMFHKENIIVVTWSGGSSAVSKTDWTPLFLRDVIIWPDNDAPGFKASDTICSELRRVGVNSLRVVNKEVLKKGFPEKWDLADALPKGKSERDVQDLIVSSTERVVGVTDLLSMLPNIDKSKSTTMLQAKEVLWRVEERLRPQLEADFGGKTWEIKNKIINESAKIISGKGETIDKIEKEYGLGHASSEKLAFGVLIYCASKNCEPTKNQIDDLRQVLHKLDSQEVLKSVSGSVDVSAFVIGKYIGDHLESGVSKPVSEKAVNALSKEMLTISKQLVKQEKVNSVDHFLMKDRQYDHSRSDL